MASGVGPPTGVPTSYAGRTPLWVDTTNNTTYYYSGSAWVALVNTTGSGGGMVRIAQVVCSGSLATVVFGSIPSGYTNLMIVARGRDTTAGTSDSNAFLFMNADQTTLNYDQTEALVVGNASVSSAQPATSTTGGVIATFPNNGATTGRASTWQILIPNYTDTVFFKQVFSTGYEPIGTGTIAFLYMRGFEWKSTAAITTLTFTAGTAFLNGSIFTLYGIA